MDKGSDTISIIENLRFRRMRLIMALCLMDVLAPVLNVLQVVGVSLLPLVNVIQVVVFVFIAALTQPLRRRHIIVPVLMFFMVVVSLVKMFSLSDLVNQNFSFDAVGPYFYSLIMPFFIVISVLSQKEIDISVLKMDLFWFSKWYFIIAAPVVVIYAVAHFTGRFDYFGFGVNFHYFAPFFFSRHIFVFGIILLILLSGKRAVLLNFLIQYGSYLVGKIRRSPVSGLLVVFVMVLVALILIYLGGGYVSILLKRFFLMYDAFSNADFSGGLLGLSNSYEAIVLFGGRLEEIVGVAQYFSDNPIHIWFGSPPGANYIWVVKQSDFEVMKSFTHLTWLGYVFRYGLIPTGVLTAYLIYIGARNVNTRSPLWLVFIGVMSSATFGANLFYSPTAWTMIALFIRYGREVRCNKV